MLSEFRTALRPALVLLILFAAITGLAYPAAITGIALLLAPGRANGSLIRENGQVIGSELIAQGFAGAAYFHPRPSAAGKGYDASASAGSNLAPTSQALGDAVSERVAAARADGLAGPVPADLVTTSASGLDPDLSPPSALAQVARVAKARGATDAEVAALVTASIQYPLLGVIGEPRVNVLLLNRQLDAKWPNPAR